MSKAHLVPCPACERHVRVREVGCPFCGVELSAAVRATPAPRRASVARLSRAALFAVSGGVVTLASCSGGETVSQPLYGGVALVDAGGEPADATEEPDAGCVGVDATYGGPRVDPCVD